MTNLYPVIWGSLERSFIELFFSDASFWCQYRFIAFNIFLCRILIIFCKILIITRTFNGKTKEWTIYTKSCRNVTIFYRQELASSFQVQGKLRVNCFIANDCHIKIKCSYVVFFIVEAILYSWDNFHLLKHYPKEVPQNYFDSFNGLNNPAKYISLFSLAPDKLKNWCKVFVNCRNILA